MEINHLIVIVAAVLSMVIGAIWYGPLFGKKWMEIIGASDVNKAARKEMQKKALPLYIIQFVLVILQVSVLHMFIAPEAGLSPVLWIWFGFVIPTLAGAAMWNNNSNRVKLAQFLIQGGYQLVMFIIYAWMLTNWS